MIARIQTARNYSYPVTDPVELTTESDVEQKFIFPFLNNTSYMNIPSLWIKTKQYMTPTKIDKAAGKRFGYYPDYSVWIKGIPLFIVEAKPSDVAINAAIREARLYAAEINKRYPPTVNPVGFVLACNGVELALTEWDSETEVLIAQCEDIAPGTSLLDVVQEAVGRQSLESRAEKLLAHFQSRDFFRVTSFLGGQTQINQQLGVNEFAEPLFPTITKYFGAMSDESPAEIIDRAYVTTQEIGRYEGVLETYLKDRAAKIAGNQLKTIETSKNSATGISTEVQKFVQNPDFFSRVQLIVGSVGAGKSTFVHRFYRRLMSKEVRERTCWAFLNFNHLPPDPNLQEWISQQFIDSFSVHNNVDLYALEFVEKIFSHELKRFENGPNKRLKKIDPVEFEKRRSEYLDKLLNSPTDFVKCISRHFSGEKRIGIVVVFDNVDKRSRDLQLAIFEAAQWFKDLTRALVLINLRDSTFETHRDEPPLDAFANAINFYVRPPRFAQVIRKRLELVLEVLPSEVAERQEYILSSGQRILYPASRLGEFLMTIYLSLFDRRSAQIASALEALVAKDVRRALGMFADIIVSPHIPTNEITGTMLTGGVSKIPEFRIIRSLMRQRYRYFNNRSVYIKNVMNADLSHNRPSNLLYADILEYLIRNRKSKIDFAQEGYATLGTVVKKLGSAGYDDEDIVSAVHTLVQWGFLEPENLVVERLQFEDAVRVHAIGFIHMRFFIDRAEYVVGATTDMAFTSRDLAEEIGSLWSGGRSDADLSLSAKRRIVARLKEYMQNEYELRCKRHAFYQEVGMGGHVLLLALKRVLQHLNGEPQAHSLKR